MTWNSQRVKLLRETLLLSQREFAEKLGVRQQTVSNWETGATTPRGAHVLLLNMTEANTKEKV